MVGTINPNFRITYSIGTICYEKKSVTIQRERLHRYHLVPNPHIRADGKTAFTVFKHPDGAATL